MLLVVGVQIGLVEEERYLQRPLEYVFCEVVTGTVYAAGAVGGFALRVRRRRKGR